MNPFAPPSERFGELDPGWQAPGVYLLGCYGPYRCGTWIFVHDGECALLEAPMEHGASQAAADARDLIAEKGWSLRYLLLTHTHLDHAAGIGAYRRMFEYTPIVAHASFRGSFLSHLVTHWFDTETQVLPLGRDAILIHHAPKHSPQDCLVFFRGTCVSGDWIWGPYPEARNLVPRSRIAHTLRSVTATLNRTRYRVHSVFSSHANEARVNIDFPALMSRMHEFFAAPTP